MALIDEGFTLYAVKGEGSSRVVEELFMHFFVTCDEEASVVAAQLVMYREGCGTAVEFFKG